MTRSRVYNEYPETTATWKELAKIIDAMMDKDKPSKIGFKSNKRKDKK